MTMARHLPDFGDWRARLTRKIAHETAQSRLVRDMRSLVAGRGMPSSSGPTIGIATFGNGAWHLAIEGLLGHALAARGAQPRLLLCDMPELPICNERTAGSRHLERCAGCIDDKRELLDALRLPWQGLRSLVGPDSLARAIATVAALDEAALETYCERQWPIGRWLHVSASHYLRGDARGSSREKIDAKRRLLATGIVTVEGVERWLDTIHPDIVIAGSGAHFKWRIAFELARARGIPVVCREMGKGGWDRHIYALNADAMTPDLDETWASLRDEPLTAAEETAVDTFLADLPARTYRQPARTDSADHSPTTVPAGSRAIVAFTNVTWDFATAGRDVAFDGVLDWVSEAIRVTAMLPRTQLIVRAHPAEASVNSRERIVHQLAGAWPNLPSHVTVIGPEHPVTAAALIAQADLVLAYNSTAGLEAVMRGRHCILAGRPHFRARGFTIDVDDRAQFAAAIAAPPVAAPDRMRDLARRYCHLFYLRHHVPMGWTTSPLEPPHELLIRSLEELEPGRNPALDVVCDGILRGRQVLLPRVTEAILSCT
jgi:hypothetical protein